MDLYQLIITFRAPDDATAQTNARAALEQLADWDTDVLLGDFNWRVEQVPSRRPPGSPSGPRGPGSGPARHRP